MQGGHVSGVQYKDVVLVGKFNTPLRDLKKLIRIAGGRVHDKIEKGVDMVIVGGRDNTVPKQALRRITALVLPLVTEAQLVEDLEGFELHWKERALVSSQVRRRKMYYVPNDGSLDIPRSAIINALRRDGQHVMQRSDGVDYIVTGGRASVLAGEISDRTLAKRFGIKQPSSSWLRQQKAKRNAELQKRRAEMLELARALVSVDNSPSTKMPVRR